MYVIFVSFWASDGKWWPGEIGSNEVGIEEGGSGKYAAGVSSLALLDDYLERAGYGSGGAHVFAQSAPASAPLALFLLDNINNFFN